jgi:hypothetical protein
MIFGLLGQAGFSFFKLIASSCLKLGPQCYCEIIIFVSSYVFHFLQLFKTYTTPLKRPTQFYCASYFAI